MIPLYGLSILEVFPRRADLGLTLVCTFLGSFGLYCSSWFVRIAISCVRPLFQFSKSNCLVEIYRCAHQASPIRSPAGYPQIKRCRFLKNRGLGVYRCGYVLDKLLENGRNQPRRREFEGLRLLRFEGCDLFRRRMRRTVALSSSVSTLRPNKSAGSSRSQPTIVRIKTSSQAMPFILAAH